MVNQNTGGTTEKRDTQGKIICNCCGKSFYICHSRKKGSEINSHPYYIRATKKKEGKNVCDNDNIKLDKVDLFIEDLSKNYYKNIRLSNKARLVKLQDELKQAKTKSVVEINKEIDDIRINIIKSEQQLSKLIDNFLECSDVTKKVIDKKIEVLEVDIERNNSEILKLERSKANLDSDKLEIENKIKEIKKELKVINTTELTREQLMDKIKFIKIDKSNKVIVEYC